MRLLIDLKSHVTALPLITQVEAEPPTGTTGATAINGKYVLPIIKGVDFPINLNSYGLNHAGEIDGGDVSSISFAHLLAAYPMFGNIYFNPLLTSDHVAEIDLTATLKEPVPGFDPIYHPTRLQTGRGTGVVDLGQMPTHTALLAQNNGVDPPRPGVMVTMEIDISDYTIDPITGLEVGTDEFMLYWKLYDFTVSDDTAADYGLLTGTNEPAIRRIEEVDQEPDGFSVYLSPDLGDHWCSAGLLEPVAFCDKTKVIKVAFKNTSANKVFIACFAVLF